MATMTTNAAARAAAVGPVTVQEPCRVGNAGLFVVKAGVPLLEASDELALLISTARDAAADLAILLTDTTPPISGFGGRLCYPIAYLLELADGLHASIHRGMKAAQGGDA